MFSTVIFISGKLIQLIALRPLYAGVPDHKIYAKKINKKIIQREGRASI